MRDDETDPHPPSAELARLSAGALARLLSAGTLTSAELTSTLLQRVEAIDRSGPRLRSVLRLNEGAVDDASALDAERRSGRLRGPLHGVPVLVKDNVDTIGLGATAGSLALEGLPVAADAVLVSELRAAGAIILGKTNLSEWANFRGRPSASGWSAVGNQTRNPFALNRSPGGSSSGSGAGVAAGLAPLGVGTETDGSILCPAAACGLVGIKPTVGLVSQAGIIPISASQDTAGPMARSVEDAAALLEVLVSATSGGSRVSTADPLGRPATRAGYADAISNDLRGLRVGLVRDDGYFGYHPETDGIVASALGAFREAGADVVESVTGIGTPQHADEMTVLCTEFKAGLGAYLAQRFAGGREPGRHRAMPRSLDDVIAFNEATAGERVDLFPQDVLIRAAASGDLDDPAYLAARSANHRRTREDGIDAVCARLGLDALVAPTMAPAWMIDHVNGDSHFGASWSHAAIAGYPSLNLPIGEVRGLPVGLALWGRAFTEATLIRIASAVEGQLCYRPVPTYRPALDVVT
jgi:amidase